MLKMIRQSIFITILVLCFTSTPIYAENKIIDVVGEYTMGADDSLNKAQDGAVAIAVRNAAEQIGVMVSSYTQVNNLEVTDDEIRVTTNHYLKILSKKFEKILTESGDIHIKAFVQVSADVDSIYQSLQTHMFQNIKDTSIKLSRNVNFNSWGPMLFGHGIFYPSDELTIQTFFWRSANLTSSKSYDNWNYVKFKIMFSNRNGLDDRFVVTAQKVPYLFIKRGEKKEIISSMPSKYGAGSLDAYIPKQKYNVVMNSDNLYLYSYIKGEDGIVSNEIKIPNEILKQWKDILSEDMNKIWMEYH